MYKQAVSAVERWRLTGKIKTKTPLHVGDGERLSIGGRDGHKPEGMPKEAPEYASVYMGLDAGQKLVPYIPATSWKGALRAWAAARELPTALIDRVFGTSDSGGVVTFHDAPMTSVPPPADENCRFWSPERRTALTPQVAINPRTRSAEEGLLYYVEYVPEAAEFELAMTAQNATEEDRRFLLYVLKAGFSAEAQGARIGSEQANGWGSVKWDRDHAQASVMGAGEIRAWLSRRECPRWTAGLRALEGAELKAWRAAGTYGQEERSQARCTRIKLTLRFQGPMLVNDPTRARRANQAGQGAIGRTPLRRDDGTFFLPAQSVRGAFRAQARRIWQTLAWGGSEDLREAVGQRAVAARSGDQRKLAGFYRMFGAGGWRSPVEVSGFNLEGPAVRLTQEFVAVDRFTGGAAEQKKFNAEGLVKPVFSGEIRIREDRWERCGIGGWAWLLLAYTLRDWIEGDGILGFGASKGYGAFQASVEVTGEKREARLLAGILAREESQLASQELEEWERSLTELANREREEA